jgi:cell division protein FtsN
MKSEPMNRLFVAEYGDHARAAAELAKLKKLERHAFMLREKDKYVLYAGSFYRERSAGAEKERLNRKGISVELRSTSVAVPVVTLTAGAFPTEEAARKAADRLKKKGLSATVEKAGK